MKGVLYLSAQDSVQETAKLLLKYLAQRSYAVIKTDLTHVDSAHTASQLLLWIALLGQRLGEKTIGYNILSGSGDAPYYRHT